MKKRVLIDVKMENRIGSEVYIGQIQDGFKYKGYVHFGNRWRFQYELICDKNIGELDKLAVNDLEAATAQMHLSIKDEEENSMKIPDELVPLFNGLVLPMAINFYNNSQTKHANATYVAGGTGSSRLKSFGASAHIGMTDTGHSFERSKLEPVLEKHFG